VRTGSAAETRAFGERIGRQLRAGDVVTLSGELGSGKTVLAQGIAAGLGVDEPVTSPTFALVHEYRGRLPVWHLDLYRLSAPQERIDLSWDDLLAGGGVLLIEWPERITAALPPERLDAALRDTGDDTREITLLPRGASLRRRLRACGQ
jgi:tRNA threonylcarbamoyladenosine biosynthesis protein TsaE